MRTSFPLHSGWQFKAPGASHFLSASVPGCIHTDLRRHDLIPDPFWGSNEQDLQWIEEKDWHYRCDFEADPEWLAHEHLDLVMEGLDTVAAVRLNGRIILETDNMFIGHRVDIASAVRRGKNRLEVLFTSPMRTIRGRQLPGDAPEWNDPVGGCSHLRKGGYSFGWDWGPRFATSGIYKPVRLEAWSRNRFEHVQIRQKHKAQSVEIFIDALLARRKPGEVRGTLSLHGKEIAQLDGNHFTVRHPELWWPNGYGAQPLYTVELQLIENGNRIDTWSARIGLRTIVLDRHPDAFGESFQFVVNGLPIFAKGASWIPASSFVSDVDRPWYDNLLSSAAAAHMNMIRVWGGGIYEMDDFYDLCDEKGLLVWQDFMFACALYPGGKTFLASVEEEAVYQIRRLHHHPSLALWCGNNEIEMKEKDILATRQRQKAYEEVFYKILPRAVDRWDGVTAYWPCSPHNPKGYRHGHLNEAAGDAHFWDVWHARFPVKRYEEFRFRFYSEFGMQSYSSPEVAATFCPPEELNIFAPAMENHQKNGAGNAIILDYVSRRYRMPHSYDALAYLSQLNQAYCMKIAVEHCRRSMPRTMGALIWQLNDCWPVFSWSSIEFGGKWKALHWAAKRFFAPLLVSAHLPGDETVGIGNTLKSTIHDVHLYTVYDGKRPTTGCLEWKLCHLDGRVLEQGEKKVTLRYGKSQLVKKLDYAGAMERHGAAHLYLRLRLESAEGEVSEDTVFLTAPRRINFPRAAIATRLKAINPLEWELTLQSDALQTQCEIILPGAQPSDNYIDLYPGEPRRIRLLTSEPIRKAQLEKALRIRSLVDTY